MPTHVPHNSIGSVSTAAAERPVFAGESRVRGKQVMALVDMFDDGQKDGSPEILRHKPVASEVQEQRSQGSLAF